jgi:anaerobic selenocysteine-containing dehydrogenase
MNLFCSKDCPDLCGVKAELIDGAYKFSGIAEDWSKTGFVCSKFKVFAEREINNGIKSYKVTDGVKIELSDDEAVEELYQTLLQHKDKKILYMRGSGSLAYNMMFWDLAFANLPNCYGVTGGPCDNTGSDAHEKDFGECINPPVTNLEKADTLIVYGKNAAVCSQHFYAYMKELKKKGKKIIYLDPVKTKTAELADIYIPIKPCCDGMLACAILCELGLESGYNPAELISQTGVSKADFDMLVDCIRNEKCAHIQGFGIQRHTNGMNAYQWIQRLAVKTDCQDLLFHGQSSKRRWTKPSAEFCGYVHVDNVAQVLADGEFDLYINAAANPAMTFPDTNLWTKGLSRTKCIVIDTNHTETSAHADLFVKVGGMFSQKDFMGSYFFPHYYTREKLVSDMSDSEAAVKLADKMGIKLKIMEEKDVTRKPEQTRNYQTETLSLTMPDVSDKIQLITSSHHAYLNSQILPGMEKGLQVAYMNPADAKRIGVKTGDDVVVTGEAGEFTAEALVTDGIVEKCIMCWKNIPMKEGYTNNAIKNKLTDSETGLVYYTHFVDVRKK